MTDFTISDPARSLKTLGVHWATAMDEFHIATPDLPEGPATKRVISSAGAITFDMPGWYVPALLYIKILLQQLWRVGKKWDDPAPKDIEDKFQLWKSELHHIRENPVPRRMTQNSSPVASVQLHGFADASKSGFGAAVYIRLVHKDTTISIALVAGKTRVAPKKHITIPRLELLGSLLLARMMPKIAATLQVECAGIFCWIDSQVVLRWINKPAHQLKEFVRNRVTDIQESIPLAQWNYVKTNENLEITPPEA